MEEEEGDRDQDVSSTFDNLCSHNHKCHKGSAAATASNSSSSSAKQSSSSSENKGIITSHFDSVLECCDYLESVEEDDAVSKQDVIDVLKGRLHDMITKIMMNNTITSMSVQGWKIKTEAL